MKGNTISTHHNSVVDWGLSVRTIFWHIGDFVMTINCKRIFSSLLAPFRMKTATSETDEEVLASIISHMAHTGVGTDACLRHGCLPLPVNFHSPVPDLTDLEQRGVWNRVSSLEGIDFRHALK